eukprot:3713847-Pyramimonas_sp.AAC.1
MRTHLAEVGRCRASLLYEAHLLMAPRDMLDLVYRDMYQHRADSQSQFAPKGLRHACSICSSRKRRRSGADCD